MPLTMTCQPAIHIDIFTVMTFQAHAHSPVFMRQAVQVGNLPVALLASDLTVDVPLVIKQHVFGNIIDFYPGR